MQGESQGDECFLCVRQGTGDRIIMVEGIN